MAKNSTIIQNNLRKRLYINQTNKRKTLTEIVKNVSLEPSERLNAQIKLAELPRNGSKVRYRNRCSLTGRPRGYFRFFGLSRIALRDLASWGHLPGVKKSSW